MVDFVDPLVEELRKDQLLIVSGFVQSVERRSALRLRGWTGVWVFPQILRISV